MITKKRKWIAALLALVLAVALAVPAMAIEDLDPPVWQRWGFESLEYFMSGFGLNSYDEYLEFVSFSIDYYNWIDQYKADHPDYVDGARAVERWRWWGFESEQEFYDWYGFESEEEYLDWIVDWYLDDLYYDYIFRQRMIAERVALGGPEEGLGVMWMGEYVRFPDAVPEITDDRTMVPIRAFMELTGADVGYDAGRVTLTLPGGDVISFLVGGTEVTLDSGGNRMTKRMDVAPYVKDDRTFVPIRFFSEILGYEVYWDDYFATAVVIDRDAVIAGIDQHFTIINRVLANGKLDPAKAYETTATLNAGLTLFDTIGGDQTADVTAGFTMLTQAGNTDVTGTFDIAALLAMVITEPEALISFDAFKNGNFEVITNAEDGRMYMRSSASAALFGVPATDWISTPYGVTSAMLLSTPGDTVGSIIYNTYGPSDSYYYYVYAMQRIRDAEETLGAVLGDSQFVRSGDSHKLTIDIAKFRELNDSLYLTYAYMQDFSLTLTVGQNGDYSGSLSALVSDSDSTSPLVQKQQITAAFSYTASDGDLSMTIHVQNLLKLTLDISRHVGETTRSPRSAPPPGATVINIEDLYTPPEPSPTPSLGAYKSVLLNETDFFDTGAQKDVSLGQFLNDFSEFTALFGVSAFTVIDLDHDGTPEVVLRGSAGENIYFYEILHYQDGTVYGYAFPYRGFQDLRVDGTFMSSSSAGDWGICSITFDKSTYSTDQVTYCGYNLDPATYDDILGFCFVNHESATMEEFDAAVDQWMELPCVTWYDFTTDNIAAKLS